MGFTNYYDAQLVAQSRMQQFFKEAQQNQMVVEAKMFDEEKLNVKESRQFSTLPGYLLMLVTRQ